MRKLLVIISLFVFGSLLGCGDSQEDYYPKPKGFLRMDFPERTFKEHISNCPFAFEIPTYFEVNDKAENCNKDIQIDRFNATLYLTYLSVDTNLMANIEYSRKLAYEHNIRADAIEESVVKDADRNVYGLKYNIKGDAASQYQFYLTDSISNFVRGALYFNSAPNYDSLRPSLEYVVEDIDHIISTLEWRESIVDSTDADGIKPLNANP